MKEKEEKSEVWKSRRRSLKVCREGGERYAEKMENAGSWKGKRRLVWRKIKIERTGEECGRLEENGEIGRS